VPAVVISALRASIPVLAGVAPEQVLSQVVVTDKLVGGAVAPIVPDKVKLSVAVIVKPNAPVIAPEIVCAPLALVMLDVAPKAIAPE